MTLEEFRILHSTLIEHYQFIENHLKGIYAKVFNKNFYEGLLTVENDNLNYLINELKKLERQKKVSVITTSCYEEMEEIRKNRNYWCHNCYYDMIFDSKTSAPKSKHVERIVNDLRIAKDMRDTLHQAFMDL